MEYARLWRKIRKKKIRADVRYTWKSDKLKIPKEGKWVYVVDHYKDKIIKIGRTSNLNNRFRSYCTHAGKFNMYVFQVSNEVISEKMLLNNLSKYKIREFHDKVEKYRCYVGTAIIEAYNIKNS